MQTLLLIDGNALIHRAYHALPPFKSKQGLPTNAVYGFFSILHKALTDFKPTHLAVCFDTPEPTFRKKLFKNYQIQRPKLEDDFKTQIPIIKKGLDKGGIIHLEKPGFEADDIIGTIINKLKTINIKILILTGDKDIFQLINDNVLVVAPLVGLANVKIYDQQEVKKRLSIAPSQIPDYKGLMGDPSDNYPGAKGIGPKTAAQLINQFKTIENLFNNLHQLNSPRLKKILLENKKNIFLSKKLATINSDVDIRFNLDQARFKQLKKELKDYLLSLDIKTLTKRLFDNQKEEQKNNPPTENQMGLF